MNRPTFTRRVFVQSSVAAAASAATLGAMSSRSHAQPVAVPTATGPLPRGNAAALGIDPAGVLKFIEAVNEHPKIRGLHGLMVLRHGQVAAEAFWAPYVPERRHLLWSLSKSFASTAVGLGVQEGRLSVEDKVVGFFPELLPPKVSENLAAMRVKDLLSMSTGHDKEPQWNEEGNWVQTFLATEVVHRPGSHFLYNSSATHVLSAIMQKVTGQTLTAYLTPRLFEPLGIVNPHWEQTPMGIDIGGYGLSVRLEDIAKFGQLYLQKGRWQGRQIVPEAWVAEATRAQVSNGDPATGNDWNQGYGYQFWRCSPAGVYRGDGAFGQYCIVLPEQNAVVAIFSNVDDMGAVMQAAWANLLPAMGKARGEGGGGGALRIPPQLVQVPAGSASSPMAGQVAGKVFGLDPNEEGILAVRVSFEGGRGVLQFSREQGDWRIPFGFSEWVEGDLEYRGRRFAIASRAAWGEPGSLTVKTCFIERPDDWSSTLEFSADGREVTVTKRRVRFGFVPPEGPDLRGRRAE